MKQIGITLYYLARICFILQKYVKAFSRILLELRAGDPNIKDLKSMGVGMEAAIFNGFKIHNPNIWHLICVHHLRKRDIEKALKLLGKTNQTAA